MMRRFFAPPEQSQGDVFELPEREARHATQVLRLGPSDELTVLDGEGGVMQCTIESATKRSLVVHVRERQHRAPLPCPITLIQAVPKGPVFETIVQKATELGAARVIPLLSERVVTHVGEKDTAGKVEKWKQIAIESIKQCGSPWLPVIEAPVRFDKLVHQLSNPSPHPTSGHPLPAPWRVGQDERPELSVVCSLEERSRTLREVVAEFTTTKQHGPRSAVVWIGPEGDFTLLEYAAIAKLGAVPITLGPLILRADTAAIAILALLNAELQ